MAWVINKAFPGEPIDKPYKHYNRIVADILATTPQYAGERVIDTDAAGSKQYLALGKTTDTFVENGPTGPD